MKVNNKFLNIESKSKKSQIEKEIHEFEDEKSKKIMQLGLSAYDKIRRGNIDESLFGELIYEIKKIDLEIYNRMLDIADMEGHNEHTPICECGYISKNNEKFCPNCGKEIKKDKEFILCDICASKIDADSKFCVCCGSKVVKKEKFDIDNYEIDESEYEIDDEDESYRYADDEELDTIDSSVEIVNEEVLDSENEENRELYEEYNLENKESNKEEIEDNLKFDDQKIELNKKGN